MAYLSTIPESTPPMETSSRIGLYLLSVIQFVFCFVLPAPFAILLGVTAILTFHIANMDLIQIRRYSNYRWKETMRASGLTPHTTLFTRQILSADPPSTSVSPCVILAIILAPLGLAILSVFIALISNL